MILFYVFPFVTLAAASSSLQLIDLSSPKAEDPQYLESCNIGDIIQNECHKCVCSQNFYQCTALACNKDQQKKEDSTKEDRPTCHPNMIYVENSTTCICDHNGKWPHKHCYNIFGSLSESKITKQSCDPDSYVIIDCNVCRCNSYGAIDKSKCTKNICEKNKHDSRRTGNVDKVYGECQSKNWYSFAPCQFCYCVHENKLVCNTGNNKNLKPIELGNYKLTVCGENLLKDAAGLVPDAQQVLRYGEEKKDIPNPNMPLDLYNNQNKMNLNIEIKSAPEVESMFQSRPPNRVPVFSREPMNWEKPVTREQPINREINKVIDANRDDDKDEEEESDNDVDVNIREENEQKRIAAREGLSTALPLADDEDVVSSESNELPIPIKQEVKPLAPPHKQSPTSIYLPVPPRQQIPNQLGSNQQGLNLQRGPNQQPSLQSKPGESEAIPKDNILRINFPMMLDKLLNMALRKSMVKLDSGTECEPGSTKNVACNICFCLVNGKMLCTDKVCE